jgi:hypothetical protein
MNLLITILRCDKTRFRYISKLIWMVYVHNPCFNNLTWSTNEMIRLDKISTKL